MRSLARWGSLPLLAAPLSSWALSLGEIEANSFLNQPLNAEIPFTATDQELATLSVSMAPAAEFLASGLEYPAFLSSIEFEVGRNAAGENVIIVRSRQAIAEPFLTMRVAVTHARGGFTREYSVFLDPPLFRADQAAPEAISAPVTRDPAPDVTRAPIERPVPQPQPQPVPQSSGQPSSAAPSTPSQPASQPSQPSSQVQPAPAGDYTVQAGDTLWSIANRYRPGSVSTNQAMISIFEANPAAFGGNINQLRRGAILRIPPSAQLASVPVATANAEVQRQIQAWQDQIETSPQLVLLPPSEAADAPGAAVPDAGSAARIDALEGEVANLESSLADTEAELAEARRLLELRDAELANLQNELAAGEPVVAPDLESEQLFVDEDPVTEVAAAEPAATEAPVEAEPEPAPAAQTAPPRAVVAEDAGPSLVDRALEWIMNPIVAIGGGVLVVLIAALAFLRRRRDDVEDVTGQWEALEAEIDDEADLAATARIRAKARKEPDMVVVEGLPADETSEEQRLSGTAEIEALGTEDFDFSDSGTAEVESLLDPDDYSDASEREREPAAQTMSSQTLSSQTVINLDQADPIAEADFHMAYGLYDQAADLIAKALKADPGNHELKLKLLEVYFVWGNKEQFLEAAKSLRAGGRKADWDKVVIMGKQICPDDPLFADATAAAGEIDLDLEGSGNSAGLDFPFEEDDSDDVDLNLGLVDTGELSLAQSGVNKAPKKPAARNEDDMLDIGARTQAGLEAALLEDTDDEAERTTPGGEIGDLDATMESPTVSTETRGLGDELTLESPTVESIGPDAPTVETPTIETPAADDDIGDTVEHQRPEQGSGIEMTAEIEIDDLGLDIDDLGDLPSELTDTGISAQPEFSIDADDELLSATGVTQVLDEDDIEHTGTAIIGDEDATMMAPGFDAEATGTSTAVLEQQPSSYDPDPPRSEDDLDLNLEDFSSALEGADTAEQRMASRFGNDLDLDIGIDVPADDEPTGTEEVSLDPQTMTEVGTKLDLARAYIDMGDPDGAKSILEEVLSEGDAGQRSEAQALINALPAA